MEPTTEMRWWWRGGPPPEVDSWFAGLPGVVRGERRTDHYLALASDPDTGVKARAGDRLEIKALARRERGVVVAEAVVGTLEHWVKWSFALAAATPDDAALDEHPETWIRTSKRRWLVDVEGCGIELAHVDVGDERWWSLAGEAPGTGADGRDRLVSALRWLVATDRPAQLALTDDCSHGYAELLLRRAKPA